MVEYSVSPVEKDSAGRFRVTVFGGPGYNRGGNLYRNDKLSSIFKNKVDAEDYRKQVKKLENLNKK
jgi:hypothetical protein